MTVAPLIAMKSTKCESLEAVGKELDRRAHTYANDVDQSGNCGPHQKARAEKCADDHKGAQTRFGGLGARLRGRR